jgi:hypothetical protein
MDPTREDVRVTDSIAGAAPVAEVAHGNTVPVEPTREERIAVLLAGYEHAMEHNSPRNMPEFTELKALLLGE